jgi:hypothetical protein
MIASYFMAIVLITQKTSALGVIIAAGAAITLFQFMLPMAIYAGKKHWSGKISQAAPKSLITMLAYSARMKKPATGVSRLR